MNKPLIILNSLNDDYHLTGLVYTWNGYTETSKKSSILKYAEDHSDDLKDKYLEFTHDIGEYIFEGKKIRDYLKIEDCSLWWMSLISEKNPWRSPQIIDCIKVMAIEKIVEEKSPSKIILLIDNQNLKRVLNDFCKKININFLFVPNKNKKIKSFTFADSFSKFFNIILGFCYLTYYFITRWKLKDKSIDIRFIKDSVFFSSYFYNLDIMKSNKGEYYSRQWEELPKLLNNMGHKTIHIENYVKSPDINKASRAKELINVFNAEKELKKHVFLDQYLSVRNYVFILRKYIKIISRPINYKAIRKAFKVKNSNINLWPLIKDDWFSSFSGKTTISNLMYINLFNNHLQNMSYQKLGFYLCENIGWERALIHAWKKNGHGTLIAVPHSTIRYWDLRYFQDKRISKSPSKYSQPVPDYYALNGDQAYNFFLENKISSRDLLKVEALRYQFLNNFISENQNKNNYKNNFKDTKMLILGDFTKNQTHLMLRQLELLITTHKFNLNLTLKPHPLCVINILDYPLLKLSITHKPLQHCANDFNVIFSSNTTSASLECFLMGKKVIIFLDENNLNFSPLRGLKEVSFVNDYSELFNELTSNTDNQDFCNNKNFFWINKDLKRWKKIIDKFLF